MAKSLEKTEKRKTKSKSNDKHGKLEEKKIAKKHKSKEKHSVSKDKKNASEQKPKSKSKSKSKSTKHEEPECEIPLPSTTAVADAESEYELDREELRQLLGSYSKEQLVDLICTTAEKGSKLVSAIDDAGGDDPSLRNIFVHGFGWDTTRENLTEFFEPYGEIEECRIVLDKTTGRAKGFGFVQFKTRKAAKKALKIPQKKMYNRTVSCYMASKKPAKEKEPIAAPVKISLSQGQQQSQGPSMSGQNMAFFGQHINPALYSGMMGNPMLAGAPNYGFMGSGLMPPSHGTMAGFGPGGEERAWYLR